MSDSTLDRFYNRLQLGLLIPLKDSEQLCSLDFAFQFLKAWNVFGSSYIPSEVQPVLILSALVWNPFPALISANKTNPFKVQC